MHYSETPDSDAIKAEDKRIAGLGQISIEQAAAQDIERLRMPQWANPTDFLKIDILRDGKPGPWTHFYSDLNVEINGRNPVDILCVQMDYKAEVYEPYSPGPTGDTNGSR